MAVFEMANTGGYSGDSGNHFVSGRKTAKEQQPEIERVVTKTLESMPASGTQWSAWLMASESGLTLNAIGQIWHAAASVGE